MYTLTRLPSHLYHKKPPVHKYTYSRGNAFSGYNSAGSIAVYTRHVRRTDLVTTMQQT